VKDDLLRVAVDLAGSLVPVPGAAADVCEICRSWKLNDHRYCNNCAQNILELARPCRAVLAISLYRKPSELRDWLTFYKPTDEGYRPDFAMRIRAIFYAALTLSGETLWNLTGGWDAVVVVPSSKSRGGAHPFESLLQSLQLNALESPLIRDRGELGHCKPSDQGFVVNVRVTGRRVLLVDDVYTTGARSQSAASALNSAGAFVVAILAVGRRINPDYSTEAANVWERQLHRTFSFKRLFE
jgi:predicted amidophosphoribosyltransferase